MLLVSDLAVHLDVVRQGQVHLGGAMPGLHYCQKGCPRNFIEVIYDYVNPVVDNA